MIRRRISLDGFWDFLPDPQQRLRPETLKETDSPRRIRVPGPWQAQFADMRDYGIVNLTVPACCRSERAA